MCVRGASACLLMEAEMWPGGDVELLYEVSVTNILMPTVAEDTLPKDVLQHECPHHVVIVVAHV